MKRMNLGRAKLCMALVAGMASFQATATVGPYVGFQFGANLAGDQSFLSRGQHTNIPQPPVPVEEPLIQNSGPAGKYEYSVSPLGQFVLGDELSFGLRPEFELSLRRDEPNKILFPDGTEPGTRKGVRLSGTSGLFNLWYDFFPSGHLHPYLGAGAGFVRFFLNSGTFLPNNYTPPAFRKADDTTAAFQAGAGINWDVFKHFTVGVDYRYFRTVRADFYPYKDQPLSYFSASYKAQSVLLSLHYHFAIPEKPALGPPEPVAVVAAPVDGDADNDGVHDSIDQCPDTPAGVKVDAKGCPLPPPCKTPALGEKISLAGCGTGDSIVLNGVNFDTDKATLTINAKTILDNVASELKAYPDIQVEIQGHTDSKGTPKHNEGLSDRRAKSVKAYLAKMGIDASRMSTMGFGQTQPIADNGTVDGRALNRRVQLKITQGSAATITESSGAGAASDPVPAAGSNPATPAPAADATSSTPDSASQTTP